MNTMVDTLRAAPYSIGDERILKVMAEVPRERFVPAEERGRAFGDHPVAIGFGQTISQPFMVAFMTGRLGVEKGHRVLEVGTGSGYQAAVLAPLAGHVYTVEIIPELAERARTTLDALGVGNVTVRLGDGGWGWPEEAPFDRIIVTCAPEKVPSALVDQLAEGGRMVIPVGGSDPQELRVIEKRNGEVEESTVMQVRFVPMVGGRERGDR